MKRKAWIRLWCKDDGEPYPDATYVCALGDDGLKGLKKRVQNISCTNASIKNMLYFNDERDLRGELSSGLYREWRRILHTVAESRRSDRLPKPETWMLKFCFALYKNTTLKEMVSRLEKIVSDLWDFYRTKFCASFDPGSNRNPEDGEISAIEKRLPRIEGLSKYLSDLYLASQGDKVESTPHYLWALVLGSMEIEQGLEYFEDGKDCWLDFLVECRKVQIRGSGTPSE